MKSFKLIVLSLLSVSLLAACGKKDGDFATRYAKNSMGATAKNPTLTAEAIDRAKVNMDIVLLRTVTTNPMVFAASILVGDQSRGFQVTLGAPNTMVQSSSTIGAYNIQLQAMCANADCNPLYLVSTASQGGQTALQLAYKFYRLETNADRDNYQLFPGNQTMTFDAVVNYLNQNGDKAL